MAKTPRPVDLEAIDRREDKIRHLIEAIGQLRTEQARLTEDNARLARDLEAAQEKAAEAEGASEEVTTLKQERDVIRTRVAEMLEQLEGISL